MRRSGVALAVFAALAAGPSAAQAQGQEQGPGPTVVASADNAFFPRSLTLAPNVTVYWENRGLNHNVKFEDGAFEQPADPMATPWRVWRHFDDLGVYRYYCEAHGGPGGQGMSGTVTIETNAAPVMAGLKVSPRRVCDRRTRRCRTTRATISFRLSEDARVTGGVDPVGEPAGRPSLDLEADGNSGTNKLRISGRRLKPGVYRVTLAAEDADGNESDPLSARFRVKRARR